MGGITLLPAALGTGRRAELLPWHLRSCLLPGNASSMSVRGCEAGVSPCTLATPPGYLGCLLPWPKAGRASAPAPCINALMLSPTAERSLHAHLPRWGGAQGGLSLSHCHWLFALSLLFPSGAGFVLLLG